MKLIKFIVVGFVFGIVLTKSEAVSWYRIYEMFQFQSFHMYGIIMVAIVTGVLGIQIIKKHQLKD
ncbi:MAG: YeeE/YedE family protein, partial [Flavobacterium sp.]